MDMPVTPTTAALRHRWLALRIVSAIIVLLIVALLAGVIWTRSMVKNDPAITPSMLSALSGRISMMTYGNLLNFTVVTSKVVIVPGTAWDGKPADVFQLEQYTLFGIRRFTYNLDCWKVRPGIDIEQEGLSISNGIAFPDEVR